MDEATRATLFVIWEDCRSLISAIKAQRWSVAQWTVTVNLALSAAGASDAITKAKTQWLFFIFGVSVAILGAGILYHYNERITRVRKRLTKVIVEVRAKIYDFNEQLGLDVGLEKSREHDSQEMLFFYSAIIGSILPLAAIVAGFVK